MRRRRNHRVEDEDDINLTPMLDVVFILLIFFVVTASFVKEAGVDIDRPVAKTAESKERGSILVAVTDTDEIWIDQRPVDVRAVRANIERLHAENPQATVVVQADRDSRSGLVIQVVDAARQAGIRDVAVAADTGGP